MKYYFDITDLVEYARRNGAVSGIQRVQMSVLRHLSSKRDRDDILCTYAVNRATAIKVCRASDLFSNEAYNASRILIKLGVEKPNAAFTTRELYEELAKYKKKSIARMLQKAKLLILGKLFPAYTRSLLNLAPLSKENDHEQKKIEERALSSPEDTDHFVMI